MLKLNIKYGWMIVLVGGLGIGGCWVPSSTGKLMRADIQQLKTDVQVIRRMLEEQHAQQVESDGKIWQKFAELSTALQEYNQATSSNDAEFGAQMERMIQDVQELRGAVETNEHRIGETETRIEQTLSQRIAELNKQNKAEAKNDDKNAKLNNMPKGKKEALAYAAKLNKDRSLEDARAAYRAIIKQWPQELGVTDEALYRLGESYFNDKKPDAALREYIKIVDKFSRGGYLDDAYYRIGLCSVQLGRLDDAQTFFGEIINNHPKSPWLKSAKTQYDEVSQRISQNKAARSKKKSP